MDSRRSDSELGMFFGVGVITRNECLGGFKRALRDAVFCSLPYPPVELAGYFREPYGASRPSFRELWCSWTILTGLAARTSAAPRRRPSRKVMTALFFVDGD